MVPEEGEEKRWHRVVVELEGEDRQVVDRALELAGKTLRANAPRWQRVEAIAQEYLGSHPPPALPLSLSKGQGERDVKNIYEWLGISPPQAKDLRAWLEAARRQT